VSNRELKFKVVSNKEFSHNMDADRPSGRKQYEASVVGACAGERDLTQVLPVEAQPSEA
jgi:hypothetical protein